MEVKPGYKQTEVGVIPEDWLKHTISELIEFEGGSQPDKSVFRSSGKPGYVRLIQIRDYKTDKYETYVPTHLARRFCTEQDIMIGRYGPPVFQILRGIAGAYNVALIKAKPGPAINCSYAYYFLKQDKLFTFIERLSQRSSGQTGVDLKELRQYPLPLPPTKAEQTAIATVLSDVDSLIESLSQLIAKKRQIKQGAMQDLLTGKVRLPGFQVKPGYKQTEVGVIPEDWEVKRLGDIVDTDPDNLSNLTRPDFTFNYIALEDVDCGFIKSYKEEVFANAPSRARRKLQSNDVLIATVRPNLQSHLLFENVDGNWVCSTGFCVVRCRDEVTHPGYLFFHLFTRCISKQIEELLTGSNYPAINSGDVQSLQVPLPIYPEQTAIATVLSDMDAEIAALESCRDKTRLLKQGMMQELLTGRVRLV